MCVITRKKEDRETDQKIHIFSSYLILFYFLSLSLFRPTTNCKTNTVIIWKPAH